MNSVKCPSCNLTNWATVPSCKRCGYEFQFENAQYDQSYGQNPQGQSAGFDTHHGNYQNTSASNQKIGLALTSMILGIVGFATSIVLIGILITPIAFILGIIALVKAAKQPSRFGGKAFAITGIVTSCVSVLFVVPIIAAIAIPNLLAARRAANEGSAISSIRTIADAQEAYRAIKASQKCPDLATLATNNLIDSVLASGEKTGYRFEVLSAISTDGGCEIRATPISASVGNRSFYYSSGDLVLRAAIKKGLPADQSDPPLKESRSYTR